MSGAANTISKQDIVQCQEIVQNLRVHELHQLLSIFHYPKIGKKQELVERAVTLLTNPKFQAKAVHKVRDIQTNNRQREAMQPYPAQNSNANMTNGTASTMGNPHHQQQQQVGQQHHHPSYGMQQPPVSHGIHPAAAAAAAAGMARSGPYPANAVYGTAAYSHHPHLQAAMNNFAQHSQHQLQQHQPQQQQHTVLPMQQTGQLRNLRVVELPFYDQKKSIVPMTELPSFAVPTRPGEGRFMIQFGVPHEDMAKLQYRSDEQPLPRYELQLRVFLLETAEEQQDAFPPGSVVRLDDYQVNLPAVIPTNKPNAEQKRYPRPVNLTPYTQPPRGRDRPHRLQFEWNGDKRAWAFTVNLVYRLNSDILLDRILKSPNARRPFEKTKNTIIRRLNGTDEDDVQMDTLKISLLDPLMRTRIRIPSRAAECTHLQSFDLNNYLMMCEKRPTWKCPVCDKNAIYSRLIIDDYFEQMLKSVGTGVDEVELLRDGTWQLPQANNTVSLDSDEGAEEAAAGDDDDIMVVSAPTKGGEKRKEQPQQQQAETSTKAQQQQKRPPVQEIDVICLSSDDEDTETEGLAAAIAASRMSGTPSSTSNTTTGTGTTTGGTTVRNGSSDSPIAANRSTTTAKNTTPVLQTNGQAAAVFGPVMDKCAKTQVAQSLALFLQSVCVKNSQHQFSS